MKKIFLLFMLCGVLLLGVTGCGKMSKEEMLEKSSSLNLSAFISELEENTKNAKEKYENKIYEIDAGVISVEDDFAEIAVNINEMKGTYFKVKFNDSDLKKLKSKTKIKFVGKIESINDDVIDISNAYYIGDVTDINGNIISHYRYLSDTCFLRAEDTSYEILGAVADYTGCTIGGEKIKEKTEVSIRGKYEYKDRNWVITEIESLEKK